MRTENDVLRSVRKYFAEVLGDAWEVRLASDEGSFEAPFARVAESGPALYTSRRVISDVVLPVQVHMFMQPTISASEAMRAARLLRDRVMRGIEVGVGLAYPRRIPLYDYAGLTEAQPSTARNSYDFLRVLDLSLNTVPDAEAPLAVVVVADIRLAWSIDTTVDPGGVTVESVRVTERAS